MPEVETSRTGSLVFMLLWLLLQIIHQSYSIYNFLGALQQLAPPQPCIVDELLRPNTEHPEWGAILNTPKTLKENMQNIQGLIDQLPPLQEEVRVNTAKHWCSGCRKCHQHGLEDMVFFWLTSPLTPVAG